MDSRDQRAAAIEVLDEMKLPQWARRIERRSREATHESLQLLLAALPRQRDVDDMLVDVEALAAFPECAADMLNRKLVEAPEVEPAPFDHRAQAPEVDPLAEEHHA